jgi:hypothetical protein
VHYLSTDGARAAAVPAARAAHAAFPHVLTERTAVVPQVPLYPDKLVRTWWSAIP